MFALLYLAVGAAVIAHYCREGNHLHDAITDTHDDKD